MRRVRVLHVRVSGARLSHVRAVVVVVVVTKGSMSGLPVSRQVLLLRGCCTERFTLSPLSLPLPLPQSQPLRPQHWHQEQQRQR